MITIELERENVEPGETINGVVHWEDLSEGQRMEIRLIWYTSGKGDRDFGVEGNIEVGNRNALGQQSFSFVAPEWPHSFSGILISLSWAIEVVMLPGSEAERRDLVIAPGGREILLHPGSQRQVIS